MKTIKKASLLFASLALVLGAGLVGNSDTKEVKAANTTVTWTATKAADLGSKISSVNGTNTGTIKTGEFEWNYTRTLKKLASGKSDYINMTNDYLQLGSGSALEYVTFTTQNIPGIIKSVSVDCASGSKKIGAVHNISISVGNESYLSATKIDVWSGAGSTKEASGNQSGNISIDFTATTATTAPLYIKSISVTYEETSTEPSIKIDTKGQTVETGNTLQFTASTKNIENPIIEWSLDSTSYGTIDSNGLFTAEKAGTATVIAKVIVGGVEYTDSTTVTVKEKPTLTSLSILNKDTEFEEGEGFALGADAEIKAIYSDNTSVSLTQDSEGLKYFIDSVEIKIGDPLNADSHNGKSVYVEYTDSNNVKVKSLSYKIKVVAPFVVGEGTWNLVTNVSDLQVGDYVIFAANAKNITATNVEDSVMQTVTTKFNTTDLSSIDSVGTGTLIMKLGMDGSNWTFENSASDLLGVKSLKNLTWGAGTTTWTISIDTNGNATIGSTNTSYGRLLYNVGSPRFTTYTSKISDSMILPQIYKFVEKDTIDKFVDDWAALRAKGGKDGICHFLTNDTRAELDALIARYNAFSTEDQKTIGNKADGGTTIANTIEYVSALLAKLDDKSSSGNSGVVITSNNSYDKTSLIALFAILGIVTISGYYIIEKKKFSK